MAVSPNITTMPIARPKRRRSTKPRISKREAARLLALRDRLEQHLETMVAFLDEMDGDPDLEPSLGSAAPHQQVTQEIWSTGTTDDREQECEDEGCDCEDEGSQCDDEGCTTTDDEPSLGWTADGQLGNDCYGEDREYDPADMGEPEDAF